MLKKIIKKIEFLLDETHEKLIAVTIFLFIFGIIHYYISKFDPKMYNKSMNFTDAIYFSATSIFTLGFGEYYPTKTLSRVLVIFQAYVFLLIILIN